MLASERTATDEDKSQALIFPISDISLQSQRFTDVNHLQNLIGIFKHWTGVLKGSLCSLRYLLHKKSFINSIVQSWGYFLWTRGGRLCVVRTHCVHVQNHQKTSLINKKSFKLSYGILNHNNFGFKKDIMKLLTFF